MAQQIPEFVQQKLQPRLHVIWWGRRAHYEVVEEISNGIFWIYIILGLAYNVDRSTSLGGMTFWAGVGILLLLATQHAFVEVMTWLNEVYVVARDETNGGGRVYKFFGWLSKRYIDDAITVQSPAIIPEQMWYHRLWGWITGEQMSKIKLASMNHVYIEGKKISPQFEWAIKQVRGFKPPKEEVSPTHLSNLVYLSEGKQTGLLRPKFAVDAAEALVMKSVYGE